MTRTKEQVKAELDALEARIDRAEMYGDPCPLYPKRKALDLELAQLERNDNDRAG